MSEPFRCFGHTPLYADYHDYEWGRPIHDDIKLFEMLTLEGAQAGLSWETVLKKRDAYREAFDGFDPAKVALYDEEKVQALMADAGIIRNLLKIKATINNAGLFLDIVKEFGSFNRFIWRYVNKTPVVGHWEDFSTMPASTPLSDQISADLKKRGFKFVGSTIVYSFLQAAGLVNDHLTKCFVYQELTRHPEASYIVTPQPFAPIN